MVVAVRVRDVREAVQLSGRAGCGGDEAHAGGRRPVHGLEGRADVHLRVEADVPLPHRRQGDRAELRRRAQPRRPTEARVTGNRLHARDRRRRLGDRRQGAIDLRRPRARPLPAPDPADQARRGLHRPTHDAVLLPGPAAHADRRAQRPGGLGPVLRLRPGRQPADRAQAKPVLSRRPPRKRRPGRLHDQREPAGLPTRRRAGPHRPVHVRPLRDGLPDPGREVRHQPPRRAVLRQPPVSIRGSSRSTTTGARSRAPARSRSRRRSTTQSTGPRWPGRSGTWQASAPTSCYRPMLARPDEHLPARRAPTRPPQGNGSRGRGPGRTRSSSMRPPMHPVSDRPRCSPSTSSRSASTSR